MMILQSEKLFTAAAKNWHSQQYYTR